MVSNDKYNYEDKLIWQSKSGTGHREYSQFLRCFSIEVSMYHYLRKESRWQRRKLAGRRLPRKVGFHQSWTEFWSDPAPTIVYLGYYNLFWSSNLKIKSEDNFVVPKRQTCLDFDKCSQRLLESSIQVFLHLLFGSRKKRTFYGEPPQPWPYYLLKANVKILTH